MFWRLLIGTVIMLTIGYLGEVSAVTAMGGFIVGLCGWFFILFEIFAGEAGKVSGDVSEAVKSSFSTMRIIVSLGWSIYPLGYFLGYLTGVADQTTLNVVYNIADLLNKICFVLACWSCAKEDSEKNGLLA